MPDMTQDNRRDELMAELHASKIPFVEFQDGQCSESRLKAQIAGFCLAREKLLLEKIGKLTNAISAIQMLIEEDIEERKGFTFNRKKILDIAEEALK